MSETDNNKLDEEQDGATNEQAENKQNERRRSTTVIMTNNVILPTEGTELRRSGSMRRRLSKQNATIEEPHSSDKEERKEKEKEMEEEEGEEGGVDTSLSECIEEEESTDIIGRGKLQRVNAVVGDDDNKLRPTNMMSRNTWSASKSLSRESNGTDYSDRSGTDLRVFITKTLHKSEEDRKYLMDLEKELAGMVNDESEQSRKFDLPSSYHRMLLHRVAAWFGLDHNVTNQKTEIVVNKSDKTKVPDYCFADFIMNDQFMEAKHLRSRQNSGPRHQLSHGESFNEAALNQYGSQSSLSNDLLMMRRAQSFDVAQPPPTCVSPIVHHQISSSTKYVRQLSLQCPQMVASSPMATPPQNGAQWAPQRSFDGSRHSVAYYPSQTPMIRKADSFGGMTNGVAVPRQYYDNSVPVVCHTPPQVLVHHHLHHSTTNYPPQFHGSYDDGSCIGSPQQMYQDGTIYEVIQQPVKYTYQPQYQQSPPQQYRQPHHPQQQQYMYSNQYVPPQYQPTHFVQPEVIVDPVQTQPFPTVEHFTIPVVEETQGYSSSHQAETANSFIKASIDGGYGSMNQEVDSSRESDNGCEKDEVVVEQQQKE